MNSSLIGQRVEVAGAVDSLFHGRRGLVLNAWDHVEYALVRIDGRGVAGDAVSVEHLRLVERGAEGSDVPR